MTVRYNIYLCGSIFISSLSLIIINNITEVFYFNMGQHVPDWYTEHLNISLVESFTIKTAGCVIPGMKPLAEEVIKFVKYPYDLNPCPHANYSLLERNKTHIWTVERYMDYYNVSDKKAFSCCYKSFYRQNSVEDVYAGDIDDRSKYSNCINFTDIIAVKDEFVRVTCTEKEKNVYDNFFIFAPLKKITLYGDSKEIPKNKSAYNVIVMGIDAVSRLNFHRTMPKTLAFIKESGGIELLGYNKVGDNSLPNLIPFLMGYTLKEIKHICHPFRHSTFDFCPFVWQWYKEAGYYTAFAEDCSNLGTFSYLLDGFIRSPTDYYAHTFINEAEHYLGSYKTWNTYMCLNEKYAFQVLLDYAEDLITTLSSHKLFAFLWEITMSHDYLNYPMVMDDSYEKFFKRLAKSKYLDESIIFLVSDHGIRWGNIRSTKQGYFEERLPFVYILTPPSFRDNYTEAYNNLRRNSQRLTTPFNIHATLSDLVNLENIKNEKITSRSLENYYKNRSISLFLPIPLNRTCKEADIVDHYCACNKGTKIDKSNKEAVAAANYMIESLNSLLSAQPQCARLSVIEIIDALEMHVMTGDTWEKDKGWREYLITVKASPSDGVFEGTLRLNGQNWSRVGEVSRLNLYGEQSRCVHNAQLKLYCYCKD